ncbi:MAG: hypothetical protein V7K98_14535 [Nostoc sp.]
MLNTYLEEAAPTADFGFSTRCYGNAQYNAQCPMPHAQYRNNLLIASG